MPIWRRGVVLVAQAGRVGVSPVARITCHRLRQGRVVPCSWKARVDLASEYNHLARQFLPWIVVARETLGSARMAVSAIHEQGIAELLHDCAFAVDLGIGGEHL